MNDQQQPLVPHRTGELSVAAQAAGAKALIEARFTVAINRPRNPLDARNAILEACRRPAFAKSALYKLPIGKAPIIGFSIRFAETAIQAWGNVDVSATIVFEDDTQRQVRINVVDLERNITYGDDVLLAKTVERRQIPEGRIAISQRVNTTGETVFLIAATEDELATKIGAAKSKAIRNSGLRLIPGDFLEEARREIDATRNNNKAADPNADLKAVVDAFASLRVSAVELGKYLGHSVETISPSEVDDLRNVFQAIRDGETTWAAVLEAQGAGKQAPPAGDAFTPPATPPPQTGTRRRKVKGAPPEAQAPQKPAEAQGTPAPSPTPPATATPTGSSNVGPVPTPAPFTDASKPTLLTKLDDAPPAEKTEVEKIREQATADGVTEGEILAACKHVNISVAETLDKTRPGILAMIRADWSGLKSLIETQIRKR